MIFWLPTATVVAVGDFGFQALGGDKSRQPDYVAGNIRQQGGLG
jgi:hypothetical protein